MSFKKIATDISASIVENTVIVTDINDDVSEYQYITLDGCKDEFYGKSDDYHGICLAGYDSESEAREGHERIVAHVKQYGKDFLQNEDWVEAVAHNLAAFGKEKT